MNASFGIDHPLIATHDITALRRKFLSLGFNMTAVGQHPWGTSTSLAMFRGCLLEIMGIYDASLIDQVPAGTFRFGRHVFEHLQAREGVALTALHSTDTTADALTAQRAGLTVAGHLEFGRDVTLPDGTSERTKTTLALLPDARFPRLSFFLCQQHRPDLIYVPQWLVHPNSVLGICGINILADEQFHTDLSTQLAGLYTDVKKLNGGFQYQTANGVIRVLTQTAMQRELGPLAPDISQDCLPCVVGVDLRVGDLKLLNEYISKSEFERRMITHGIALKDPAALANIQLRFFET